LLVILCACGVGIYYAHWHYHLKRYQAVRPGVLYRSAQPTELGLSHLFDKRKIKTVIVMRREDAALERGLFDPGEPSGALESQYVKAQGATFLHWPIGKRAGWAWPDPQIFESFFQIMDDPSQHPVYIHCVGGRHRTGSLSALYRLEYDRWPVERAIEEMYSFDFGPQAQIQELNLRTYLPRPLPESLEWKELKGALAPHLTYANPRDFAHLVRGIHSQRGQADLEAALLAYLDEQRPFALQLMQWVILEPGDPLAERATEMAASVLEREKFNPTLISTAAILIADFGRASQQQELLDLLANSSQTEKPSERYEALVSGVTNRYTPNRIPYLKPLLEDERRRITPACARYRYCDIASARLSVIVNEDLVEQPAPRNVSIWDNGRTLAQQWFRQHEYDVRLGTLVPPLGGSDNLSDTKQAYKNLRPNLR
jgi:hypothetical protein